jgi:5-methylthioadenosine/S-adenosylhomocysteine deaminase
MNKLPLCVHLAESPAEYQFIKYGSSKLATEYLSFMGWNNMLWQPMGCSPVKYLQQWGIFEQPIIAVNVIQADKADLDILEENKVPIVVCPISNAKLGKGIAPLREFLKRNIDIGIGTDSLASSNSMDMFDEMRMGLLLQRGVEKTIADLNAEKIIYLATLGGAKILGMDKKMGSIEAGKFADIIVVDLSESHQIATRNPYSALVYGANETDVILTMINGDIVFDKGEYGTLDNERIVKEAAALRSRIR